MKLLAFDTSTSIASIALYNQGELNQLQHVGHGQHAQFTLSMIEKLLAKADVSLKQLDGIAFGCGPGSFTGLRVACSIAKGLAYPYNLPLFPVSSLTTIAYEVQSQLSEKNIGVLALIDARMNQVYWAYHSMSLNAPEYVSDVADIKIDTDLPLYVAGIGYQPYYSNLPKLLRAKIVQHEEVSLRASTMIQLVLSKKITPVTAAQALPSYVRNQVIK